VVSVNEKVGWPSAGAWRSVDLLPHEALLSRRHTGTLLLSQEETPLMIFHASASLTRAALTAALLAAAMTTITGCTNQKELQALPTLADVKPIGPKGQKCYDFCAQAEVSCKHMCPKSEGLCQEDCVIDTKYCLRDCPELLRPQPKPEE